MCSCYQIFDASKTYIICDYCIIKNEVKVSFSFFISIRCYILTLYFDVLPSANMKSVVRNIVRTAPLVVRYWSQQTSLNTDMNISPWALEILTYQHRLAVCSNNFAHLQSSELLSTFITFVTWSPILRNVIQTVISNSPVIKRLKCKPQILSLVLLFSEYIHLSAQTNELGPFSCNVYMLM